MQDCGGDAHRVATIRKRISYGCNMQTMREIEEERENKKKKNRWRRKLRSEKKKRKNKKVKMTDKKTQQERERVVTSQKSSGLTFTTIEAGH